ncbi:hypothetical protein CDAR_509231 [Caerostris darwini]|uniref:Uncharacterized protein n=1 Tax=Caerostris darwini TaxID=1538125 RepID=A0AAV4N4D3_9ARAC|nr:hypothetical protein CDAR_509231 [Caerostris darwini]
MSNGWDNLRLNLHQLLETKTFSVLEKISGIPKATCHKIREEPSCFMFQILFKMRTQKTCLLLLLSGESPPRQPLQSVTRMTSQQAQAEDVDLMKKILFCVKKMFTNFRFLRGKPQCV